MKISISSPLLIYSALYLYLFFVFLHHHIIYIHRLVSIFMHEKTYCVYLGLVVHGMMAYNLCSIGGATTEH